MPQQFDSYGAASSMQQQHNRRDGQGEVDGEDDVERENQGRLFAWAKQDNIQLVSSLTNCFYISCFPYKTYWNVFLIVKLPLVEQLHCNQQEKVYWKLERSHGRLQYK